MCRHRRLSTAFEIRQQDVWLPLPDRIAGSILDPTFQEYLLGLDSEWKGHLIGWVFRAQGASRIGAALPLFPTAGDAPPEREASASESEPWVRGQMESRRCCWLSHGEPPGCRRWGCHLTRTLGISSDTAQRRLGNTWSDRVYDYWRGGRGGGGATRGRRSRSPGSRRGSRATSTERGPATSQL